MKKPNLLFITVDELAFPFPYENDELREWKRKNLPAINWLNKHGMVFNQHRAGSVACAPSRTTIHTGQYPSLHGVSQTDGAAKAAADPDMYWLDSATVPTWGAYLKANGYKNYYKGKWHVSDENIIVPGTHDQYTSYDENGVPIPLNTERYLKNNRLEHYGFDDWVGPEPHGSNPRNSGASAAEGLSGRDVVYATEIVDLIARLDSMDNCGPFSIVASFVNPHDETLFGELSKTIGVQFNFSVDETLPNIPPAPTANEDLSTKPSCQASYKDIYQQAFQPTIDNQTYRKLYYTLQKKVDVQIGRVLDALKESKFKKNTIVIFTSDHGDYLGAHGLFQKWYTAYEESIHVPFIVYYPGIQKTKVDLLTSHVDIVPTILGLLNIPVEETKKQLETTFTEIHDFVGRDLTPLIRGNCEVIIDSPQYFMTDDNVTKGLNQVNALGNTYLTVIQPSSVSTVIAKIDGQVWKYSKYFNNPEFSGNPAQGAPTVQDVIAALTTPREYEMYNITQDPIEANNLIKDKRVSKIRKQLRKLLREQVRTKRIYPRTGPIPNLLSQSLIANRFPPPS